VPYVKNEMKKLSQRYADVMEEHSSILAMRNIKPLCGLKRKLSEDLCT